MIAMLEDAMKKILIFLLVLLLLSGVGAQAQETYFPKEHVVRFHSPKEGEASVKLKIAHKGAVALLTASVPLREGLNDLPLCNMLWTSRKLSARGAQSVSRANQMFNQLLSLYHREGWEFTKDDAVLEAAGPAMLTWSPLWVKNAIISVEINGEKFLLKKLSGLETSGNYEPVSRTKYLGVATGISGCNLRSGPSGEHEKVGSLQVGESYPVIEKEGFWVRLEHPQIEKCWVSEKLVTFAPCKDLEDAHVLFQKGDMKEAQDIIENYLYLWLSDEYLRYQSYLDAEKLNLKGKYIETLEVYKDLGDRFGALEKAELLDGAQALPESGAFMESEGDCELVFAAPEDGSAYAFLVDNQTGAKACFLFARAGESATARLPEGEYKLCYARGDIWYGEEKAFGKQGMYAALDKPLSLQAGQRARVVLSPKEGGEKGFTVLNLEEFIQEGKES